MRIRCSPEAAEDLERIAPWIQQNNPKAAKDTTKTTCEGRPTFRVPEPRPGRTNRKYWRTGFCFARLYCGLSAEDRDQVAAVIEMLLLNLQVLRSAEFSQ